MGEARLLLQLENNNDFVWQKTIINNKVKLYYNLRLTTLLYNIENKTTLQLLILKLKSSFFVRFLFNIHFYRRLCSLCISLFTYIHVSLRII